MTNSPDFADQQVKGLARFFPTPLCKVLLSALIPAALVAFNTFSSNPAWFGIADFTQREQTYSSYLVATAVAIAILIAIVLDLVLVIHQHKHRRIVHYKVYDKLPWVKILLALGGGLIVGFLLGINLS